MKIKQIHTILSLTLCATTIACSDNETLTNGTANGKNAIELNCGASGRVGERVTRAEVSDGTNKTMQNFDADMKLFMVMMSEYDTGHPDFGGNRGTKYTISRGDVASGTNAIVFDDKNLKYWEDAHARSTMLNIYAYTHKNHDGNTFALTSGNYDTDTEFPWTTTAYVPKVAWDASGLTGDDANKQNATTVVNQDLLFSNNLADNRTIVSGKPDNRLKYDFGTRKFPTNTSLTSPEMKFHHALSKIVIKIIEGDGFDKTSAQKDNDFQFTTGNIKLQHFNTSGTFDIVRGEFESVAENEIPQIYCSEPNTSAGAGEPYYTLEALAVPNIEEVRQRLDPTQHDYVSRFVSGATDKSDDANILMEFIIDNNKYQVTSGQLFDALHVGGNPANALVTNATEKTDNGTYIPLEAGKCYEFTFTIGKTKINNITAQVADWERVDAENISPSNARIKLQLEERGTKQTTNVAFWKANDNNTGEIDDNYTHYSWKTGYTNLSATYSTDHWTTNYFWESNKDFYHFRALMPDDAGVTVDSENGDFATLTSASSYTDVCWGAPMKDDSDNETPGTFMWTYDATTNGFDNSGHTQIYKAIGPTEDPVKLILFHMMSDLTFNIKTTGDADKVELCHDNGAGSFTHTRLDLVGFYNGGKVILGTGLVKTTGDPSTIASPVNIGDPTGGTGQYTAKEFSFGAVPQDLTSVKLYITTPDKNQYIVDLKDVKALAANVTSQNIVNPYQLSDGKYAINRWYPGFKYNYSFTLKKTGIIDLQATILQWETVTADGEEVTIK